MMVQITEDTDVRRMFNARPLNNTPTAIRDTMMLWFHMAILKKRQRGQSILASLSLSLKR